MPSRAAPNLLLVVADDHRADAIGALGHPAVRTPVLDGLVRGGTAFTQARIMGSLMPAVCAPSRACLLTGRNVVRADAAPRLVAGPDYEVELPASAPTLPEWLRGAGYETFFTGKWHNDLPALLRSFGRGSAIFHGGMCDHTRVPVRDLAEIRRGEPARAAAGFSTEIFCRAAETFLRGRNRAQPFFACVALTSPHDPRTPPAEFRARYDAARLPLPENFLPEHPFDNGELAIRDERLAERPLQPAALREHLAGYYGMISHHDAWLGRVLETLRETGDAENTVVVYISDHGLALGSHGLLGKQNLYEPSLRVPFILHGPGVPRDRRCAALAYAFDLFPTLCDLAGVAPPPGLDSRSLVPAFAPGAPPVRTETGALYKDGQRAITDGRWKLIVCRVACAERVQLFDLESDPHERHDLAAAPVGAAPLARLTAQLARWRRELGDTWLQPLASEAVSR